MFDLHFHSDASDGEASFATVLAVTAAHRELRRLALTDHDAIEPGIRLAELDSRVWIGAELTSYTSGRRIDLLALGVRPDDAALNGYLAARVGSRRQRFALFGEALRHDGWIFAPPDAVWAKPQLAQPHLVAELRRHGENRSRLRRLGVPEQAPIGADDPIYAVVLEPLRPAVAAISEIAVPEGPAMVAMIHAAGGLAVVAHPWISPYERGGLEFAAARAALAPLLAAGLDGLELWHPDQRDAPAMAELADLAARHGLLVSGGSDDHTPGLIYLGSAVPASATAARALEGLERAWRRRQTAR